MNVSLPRTWEEFVASQVSSGEFGNKSIQAEPMPLAAQLGRDADDNLFVATAAAVQASFLVTQDRDLLCRVPQSSGT
jgi:predicted nucleic acid-binding protein